MSRLIKRLALTSIAAMAVVGSNASAATFFVANPGSNSSEFQAAVAAAGGTVVTNANFETPTTGGTLTTVNFATSSGTGPGQGNTSSPPTSSGEGLYSASNYLRSGSGAGSFTFTFTSAVAGLGFTTIDLFNPGGLNDISLSVFSGANGTGTLLGSATAADFNFQNNFKYFMGFVSNSQNIGSFVVTNPGGAGDVFGVDNIVSANISSLPAVPEPGTWAMMILGFGAVGGAMRRRLATAKASRMRLTYA